MGPLQANRPDPKMACFSFQTTGQGPVPQTKSQGRAMPPREGAKTRPVGPRSPSSPGSDAGPGSSPCWAWGQGMCRRGGGGLSSRCQPGDPELALHLLPWGSQPWDILAQQDEEVAGMSLKGGN